MKSLGEIPPTAEITPESLYLRRREFLRNALLFTATSTSVGGGVLWLMQGNRAGKPKASSVSTSTLTVATKLLVMPSQSQSTTPYPWLKPAVFVGALVPIAALLLQAWRDELGANPISQALNQLGLVALIFLVAALIRMPLKTLFGWTWPLRLRRMLGLFGFAYAMVSCYERRRCQRLIYVGLSGRVHQLVDNVVGGICTEMSVAAILCGQRRT